MKSSLGRSLAGAGLLAVSLLAVHSSRTFVSGVNVKFSSNPNLRGAGVSQQGGKVHSGSASQVAFSGAGVLLAAALAAAARRSAPRPQTRQAAVACAASPQEESLKRTIGNAGSKASKDVQRVIKEIEGLELGKDALKFADGDWKADWNSVNGTQAKKTLMNFVCDKLPNTLVAFFDSYYRISADRVEFVEAFHLAGNERIDAALVWSGARKKAKGKESKIHFQFDTIQLCPADAAVSMSKEMLQSEGLGKYMKPVSVKEDATYIELDYCSESMQAHHEEDPNARWALSKYKKIPFILESDSAAKPKAKGKK